MPYVIYIPDYEEGDEKYPGNIEPGLYTIDEIAEMLREHAQEPEVIDFIAAMIEE